MRATLRAAGKLDVTGFEGPAIEHLQRAALPEKRAAAEALGRIGGQAGLSALRALATKDDDLDRRRTQAIALIERRELRSQPTKTRPRLIGTARAEQCGL